MTTLQVRTSPVGRQGGTQSLCAERGFLVG